MFLLPLQALQAASMDGCAPGRMHAARKATGQVAPHVHGQPGHDHGHPPGHAHADAPSPHAHATHHPATADTPDHDHGPGTDVHSCCHAAASLPVQPLAVGAQVLPQLADGLRPLPALSHETSGPFRPPRLLSA